MASQGTRSLDGWLQRLAKTLSGGREMWQRRWFVLQGDTLSFFNAPDDVGGPPKWSIDLSNGSAASVGAEPTRIELYVGSEHIALKADSEVEAEMWVSALATETAVGIIKNQFNRGFSHRFTLCCSIKNDVTHGLTT